MGITLRPRRKSIELLGRGKTQKEEGKEDNLKFKTATCAWSQKKVLSLHPEKEGGPEGRSEPPSGRYKVITEEGRNGLEGVRC